MDFTYQDWKDAEMPSTPGVTFNLLPAGRLSLEGSLFQTDMMYATTLEERHTELESTTTDPTFP